MMRFSKPRITLITLLLTASAQLTSCQLGTMHDRESSDCVGDFLHDKWLVNSEIHLRKAAIQSFLDRFRAELHNAKVTCIFDVLPNGWIVNPRIVESTGSPAVNQALLEAVKTASPLEPPAKLRQWKSGPI